MTALSETKRYQAYPEYKDSGVEWLDDIPKDWCTRRLKHMLESPMSYGANEAAERAVSTEPRYIRITDMNSDGTLKEDTFRSLPRDIASDYLLKDRDILLARSGATVGKSFIYRKEFGDCCFAGYLIKVSCDSTRLNSDYAFWFFQSSSYWQYISGSQIQATIQNVSAEKYGEIYISLPEHVEEQTQIANFLDHETAKIDTLIEKQQQLIKLLKEKRQAVISHAVTKGLNPQAPMKDSGVEWLGEVPEHWKIVSVRNLIRGAKLQIQDGNHGELHPVANDYVDDGIPFLMANNVRNGKVDTSSCKRIPKALADKLRIGFAKVGDMLLTHKGTVGEVGIIPEEMREDYWMLTPQVTYYRWSHHSLHNEFFYYQFQSVSVATQLDIIAGKQSTRGYVGLIAQGDIELAIPPLNEQLEIASQLQADVKKHEDLIQKAEKLVLLQKERRTALISAAVTGKIDVRNWQAPTHQDQALEQTA
ncbi:restriction endonuclease subunit S [Vibrio fluvialis]|nr:restriction endonuclease subunit S [Vibrio fluvialis]MBY8156213.1 restriction endonuclease subunit S [Vibrio fluvialis]